MIQRTDFYQLVDTVAELLSAVDRLTRNQAGMQADVERLADQIKRLADLAQANRDR